MDWTFGPLKDVVATGSLEDVKARIRPGVAEWRGQGGQNLLFPAAARPGDANETIAICRFFLTELGLDINLKTHDEKTPLFGAARVAPSEVVSFLLESNAEPNVLDKFRQTPLFYSVSGWVDTGCSDNLELLLRWHADPNHQDSIGQTALFYAAKSPHAGLAAALIRHIEAVGGKASAAVSVIDTLAQQTPLFYAGKCGYVETCALLIDKRSNPDSTDKHGQSTLFYAAREGHAEVVRLLLDRQAVADMRDYFGETPLFYGVKENRTEVCRVLIELGGANPQRQSEKGHTPVEMALRPDAKRPPELLALMEPFADSMKRGKIIPGTSQPAKKRRKANAKAEARQDPMDDDRSSVAGSSSMAVQSGVRAATPAAPWVPDDAQLSELALAIRRDSPTEVRRLLAAGHDPNAASAQCGLSVFALAALRTDRDDVAAEGICRALVEEGKVDDVVTLASPALLHTVQHGLVRCTSYLLSLKCEVHRKNESGQTPLFLAAGLESSECLRMLLAANEDPNSKDLYGKTPLFEALTHGRLETVELLIQQGATADIVDFVGKHSLDVAAPNCVPVLLAAKCDVNTRQCQGGGLSLAVRQGHLGRAKALLEARADVALPDLRGWTALREAVEQRALPMCKLLMEHEADAAAQDAHGVSPLQRVKEMKWSSSSSFEQSWRACKSKKQKAQEAQMAVRKQDTERFSSIVSDGSIAQVKELLRSEHNNLHEGDVPDKLVLEAAGRHADKGDPVEVCRVLIEGLGLDPSKCQNKEGQTALFPAAWVGNVDVCNYMVQQKCSVNAADSSGRTALFFACNKGQKAVVQRLIQLRADVSWRDTKIKQTALFFAARGKTADCANILVENKADASPVDSFEQTPLFYAARDGNDEAVRLLVRLRSDVNMMDKQGKPPLWYAVKHQQPPTARLLLEDCDAWPPEDRSQGAANLLEMAMEANLNDVVHQLQTKAQLRDKLLSAAKDGSAEDVDAAMGKGASTAAVNAAGWSALHCAASRRAPVGLKCIQRLVEAHGASVTAQDRQQQTPLFIAARDGTKECVLYLLNAKCDAGLVDRNGDTALFDAAQKCRPEVVALLLQHGASASHKSSNRQTAAFRAARAGSAACLLHLLNGGAPANDVDEEGHTALFGVQDLECAQLLLERQCSVEMRDNQHRTALFEAEGHNMMKLLLAAKASVNAQDQTQQTAIFPAAWRGDIAAVRALLEAKADGNATDIAGQTVLFGAAPRTTVDVIKLLVCEAWANPAIKDNKGQTAAQVAKKARPPVRGNVVDYLNRAVRAEAAGGKAGSQEDRRRRYRVVFADPMDSAGVSQVQPDTPQYEEALQGLSKQCPWLKVDLWLGGPTMTNGSIGELPGRRSPTCV